MGASYYVGAQARYYDQYFTGLDGEAEFYAALSRETGPPILELGCGTARTMLPIAAAGLRIVGVEGSAQMLHLARRKLETIRTDLAGSPELGAEITRNIALVRADMRRFRLRAHFRLVILPYRTFQHLLTELDRRAALRCIHQHLEPGGFLAFNVFDPGPDIEAVSSCDLQRDATFVDAETGAQIEVWFRRSYDLGARLLTQEIVYRSCAGEGATPAEEHSFLTLRCADPLEIEELLETSGFRVQALCGDFQGSPFEGSGEQVWLARRA